MRPPRAPREGSLWARLAVVAGLGAIIAFWILRPDSPGVGTATDPTPVAPGVSATTGTGSRPTQTPTTTPSAEASATTAVGDPFASLPAAVSSLGRGINGKGITSSLPKHTVTVRLSTNGQLGRVAYIIPTSPDKDRGSLLVDGSSWTLTTTVFGDPDYAAVFGQSSIRGNPVTCTITVDGRVTERRTTEGAYGAMWCLG